MRDLLARIFCMVYRRLLLGETLYTEKVSVSAVFD